MIAGAVTRAVPGLFARIPTDDAPEVRADRGTLYEEPLLVAIDRGLGEAPADDAPAAPLDVSGRGDLARSDKVAVLRDDVQVLLCELRRRSGRLPGRVESVRPSVSAALNEIGEEHAGDRPVRHSRAAEAGGDEYALFVERIGSDECQTV